MTYIELLRNPLWQKKRLEIMQERQWMCECCFSVDKCLHVHHKRYVKGFKPWEYKNEDFSCLCEDCHLDVEILKLQKKHDMAVELKMNEWKQSSKFKELQDEYNEKGSL